jgi:hypothetical protein
VHRSWSRSDRTRRPGRHRPGLELAPRRADPESRVSRPRA